VCSSDLTNADGSVIVGMANYNPEVNPGQAFIWDALHGMRDLRQVLMTDYHLNLQGMSLNFAEGVSADGRVIAGYGIDLQGEQEAWVANLEDQSAVLNLGATLRTIQLEPNQPNPCPLSTPIPFRLSRASAASLLVYDQSGRLVQTLLEHRWLGEGEHAVTWDGRSGDGRRVAAGTYFYRLETGGRTESQRLVMLK
jgi:hypothetical protein